MTCWFGHGDTVRDRDDEGRLVLRCTECGKATRVLATAVVKGPLAQPAVVKGEPLIQAKTVRQGNVREFTRQSER